MEGKELEKNNEQSYLVNSPFFHDYFSKKNPNWLCLKTNVETKISEIIHQFSQLARRQLNNLYYILYYSLSSLYTSQKWPLNQSF